MDRLGAGVRRRRARGACARRANVWRTRWPRIASCSSSSTGNGGRLREHARRLGIGLIGDLPIFVAHDSADVWSHPELFQLDRSGQPQRVSGYPPDRFNRNGQRWGHPQYRWARA